jgi:hypothetical protein
MRRSRSGQSFARSSARPCSAPPRATCPCSRPPRRSSATAIWRDLRPRWALVGLGAAVALVGGGASFWAAERSFDATAFESPTYFARGAELGPILEVAEDERVRSEYGSTFASVLRSISTVLADVPAREAPGRQLYLASDLHGNALVVDPLARAIGEAPVLLAGDFGQRGASSSRRSSPPGSRRSAPR